ncbi:MAG: DUF92 domain-containing protein [Thermofilum sp.]
MQSVLESFAMGVAVGIPLAVLARSRRSLDRGAAVLSVLFSGLYMLMGPAFFACSLAFFFSSSAVTKIGYSAKKAKGSAEKEAGRSAAQVVGAGGVAAALSILFVAAPEAMKKQVLTAALAAISASNADTWAAEIGSLSRERPRLITRPRVFVEPGTSGGVTLLGELGSVAGSALIALTFLLATSALGSPASAAQLVLVFLLGWLGELLDSIIGATLQRKFYCPRCSVLTDKEVHGCGSPAKLAGGFTQVTNEVTNIIATGAVSLLGFLAAAP